MNRLVITGLFLLIFAATASGQGVPIKDATTASLAKVNTLGAFVQTEGESTDATYVVHVAALALTASDSLINIESEASRGFRISQVCIAPGQATAAAHVLWQLIRTTTASSGGTVIASESTTTHSVTKMDPAAANWSGLARAVATEGTSGAVLDQGTLFVNVATTPPTVDAYFCREYGMNGGQLPIIAAGVGNGVKLMFTGTAGGAGASAMIRFIAK